MRRRSFLGLLSLAAARGPAAAPRVAVGLERLGGREGAVLRGRRLGLLAHAASTTADGRHAVDVLQQRGLDLRRLFAPEHGLRGRAPAGTKVPGGRDPQTGLPLVSLYGDRTRPSPDDLRGLDALVVDLQDAGVRFYTYVSTMLLALDAAAGAGIGLVVLDRPDPLGGEGVAGPEREPAMPVTLLSTAPGPLVHGLTLGEMARFANARRERPARLTVVPMAGWSRAMTWPDTGRPWVPPSPNLRSAEASLAYPGTCLLEATNVSEGRGTETPFLRIGAPWLKPEALARAVAVPGYRLESTSFTPVGTPAAPRPKYEGRACAGVRVRVVDPGCARPWALGVSLLVALRRLHPEFAWAREGAGLDALLGTRAVRAAVDRGEPAEAVLAAEAPAVARFVGERRAALLY